MKLNVLAGKEFCAPFFIGTVMEGCEWNPEKNKPAVDGDKHHMENKATVCVGANGQFHLCRQCANLPQFKRFKKTEFKK